VSLEKPQANATMRRAILAIAISAALTGCGLSPGVEPPAAESASTVAASTTRPAGGAVMAVVNGQSVHMDVLYDLLLRGPGKRFAVELVRHELVRQAAEKAGVSASADEMRQEHERLLIAAFPGVDSPAEREQALRQLLAQKMVSRRQWDLSIRTSALLRKLAEPNVTVTEKELRDEFGRRYGRQVVVSHVQVSDLATAQTVARLAATDDFAELARKYSINPSGRDGGRLPPIGPKTTLVPPAIRQTALAMNRVGEISNPVEVGTTYHILKLEEIIEPKHVAFENVKDDLRAGLIERRVRLAQKVILERLIRESNVRYVDPVLRAEIEAEGARRGDLP